MMIWKRSGLIVNVSSGGATAFAGNIAYGVGKAGVDKLSADTAHQLKPHGVSVVSIRPPLIRTEKPIAFPQWYDLSRALNPVFVGSVVEALATDPRITEKTGKALRLTDLAKEYGISDVQQGRQSTAVEMSS